MKKLVTLAGVIASAAILAGCSTMGGGSGGSGGGTGGGTGGGGSTPPVTQTTSATEAASAYAATNPTTYGQAGLTTSTAALEAPGGNSAFGVGTPGAVAAVSDASAFKVGNIAIDRGANKLTLTVDGVPRTLNYVATEYGTEYFGYSMANPTNGEAVALMDYPYRPNPGESTVTNPGYVSLAVHLKGATWKPEGDYYVATSIEEYNALVTGLLTPEANMPTTASATYGGQWLLASGHSVENFFSNHGIFVLSADFVNKTLSGKAADGNFASDLANANTNLTGTISGNTFTGTANRITDAGLNGNIVGGFFGPNAEQIGGTGSGSILIGGQESGASLIFVGQQYPEGYFD